MEFFQIWKKGWEEMRNAKSKRGIDQKRSIIFYTFYIIKKMSTMLQNLTT